MKNDNLTHQVQIRLSPETYRRLANLATAESRTVSNMVRVIIETALTPPKK